MKSRFVQWVLSKLFPYNELPTIESCNSGSAWNKQKRLENEEFYGGYNGTIKEEW